MKKIESLLRSFYYFGQITNAKSFYLYKEKLSKTYYHQHLFLNFTYGIITQNLNLSLENKFTIEKVKDELKLNNFYNENNIGLFIYPNICLKHMYTINNANQLTKVQKKTIIDLMDGELIKLNENFEVDYAKISKTINY